MHDLVIIVSCMSHIMANPDFAIYEQQRRKQPAHSRSQINGFVIRYLDSIIHLVSTSEISSPYVAFFGCAGRFVSYLVANPEDRFSRDVAQYHHKYEYHDVILVNVPLLMLNYLSYMWRRKKLLCHKVVPRFHDAFMARFLAQYH